MFKEVFPMKLFVKIVVAAAAVLGALFFLLARDPGHPRFPCGRPFDD